MLGWAPPLRPFGFPLASLGFFSHHRPPETLISGFILLRASTLLQSIPHLARHPSSRRSDSFHEVSLPLRAVMGRIRRCFGFHTVAAVRPQVFSTSRRFAPLFDFAGLLRPAATSRVLPSRGFSRSTAVPARRRSVPPCRCRPNTHRPKPAATLERLDFEALLREPMRSSGLVFSLPLGRSPLRVPPPSGSAHPPWNRFPGSSAHDVPVEVLP